MRLLLDLIKIRLYKLQIREDYLTLSVFLGGLCFLVYGISLYYHSLRFYILLFSLDSLFYHFNRSDIDFLKLSPSYRKIIFLEYLLYGLPFIGIYLWKADFLLAILFVGLLLIFTYLPRKSQFVFPYPFKLFDPFWRISFRKNKLILAFPISLFLMYMGSRYENENLIFVALFLGVLPAVIPYFEAEEEIFISASIFKGKDYLFRQMFTCVVNTGIWLIPFALGLLFISPNHLIFILLLLIIPLSAVLFRYAFYRQKITQSVFFTLFLMTLIYGIPLIFVPILYYFSIQKIKQIQNA